MSTIPPERRRPLRAELRLPEHRWRPRLPKKQICNSFDYYTGWVRALRRAHRPVRSPTTTAYQDEGLTLQPCSTPGATVWIIDTADSRATAPTYFPIVNASTTDFTHPFGMTYPGKADPAKILLPQIKVRHLIGNPVAVPDRQLWGSNVLN